MGSGLHTTDDAMMRENQRRDLDDGHAAQNEAVGTLRGPTVDEIPPVLSRPEPRLVQPGTQTPARGLANVVNGHNMPGENAPQAAIAAGHDKAPH